MKILRNLIVTLSLVTILCLNSFSQTTIQYCHFPDWDCSQTFCQEYPDLDYYDSIIGTFGDCDFHIQNEYGDCSFSGTGECSIAVCAENGYDMRYWNSDCKSGAPDYVVEFRCNDC